MLLYKADKAFNNNCLQSLVNDFQLFKHMH